MISNRFEDWALIAGSPVLEAIHGTVRLVCAARLTAEDLDLFDEAIKRVCKRANLSWAELQAARRYSHYCLLDKLNSIGTSHAKGNKIGASGA